MIQRIQSIYLLIAVFVSASLFIIPAFNLLTTEQTFAMSACHIAPRIQDISPMVLVPLAVVNSLLVFFSLYAIFLFKNRKKQMMVIGINILLALSVLIASGTYAFKISRLINANMRPSGIYLMIVVIVVLYLAYRGVKKDDELVRSADRLR